VAFFKFAAARQRVFLAAAKGQIFFGPQHLSFITIFQTDFIPRIKMSEEIYPPMHSIFYALFL